MKPRRGRQRCKVVDHLFSSLGLYKAEDIRKGSCSLKSFLGVAGEERESGKASIVKLNFRCIVK